MQKLYVLLSALACALPCVSVAKVPITHEDVWTMKRVASPTVSPDGRWVVMSVTEPSYEADKTMSDLWIAPTDGSAKPRRLTHSRGGESGAAWSPNSRAIAFSARREGDEMPQIYILRLEGGEAQRFTTVSTGAYLPKWRPDGKALMFHSLVYPGAADDAANKKIAAERKALKYKTRVFESFPFQYWDRWLDDLRPHLLVQDLESGSKAKDLLAGTKFAAATGFDGSSGLTPDTDLEAEWSPDGNNIVFVATTDRDRAAYAATTAHIYSVPAAGGEPVPLTSGSFGYNAPQFRPDGKALYALQSRRTDADLYSSQRLVLLPWGTKESPVVLTEKWDRSISDYAFSPDSKTVYMIAEDRGIDRLFQIPATGGDVKPAFEMNEGTYSGLVIAERAMTPVIVAAFSKMALPPEVVVIDPAKGGHRFVSGFNAEKLATLDLPDPVHHWFTDSKGKRIHSLVVLPPGFDKNKKYPLVVFPHGGPNNMSKDQWFLRWNYHLLTSPGYVLLMTNYTGSTGFGEQFASDINKDVLRGPGREILEAADAVAKDMPFVDTTRMAGAGASYGGYLMAWFEGNTDRFKCLVNHAGIVDNIAMYAATDGAFFWERRYGGPVWELGQAWTDQNPMKYAANFETPMLITHGERDFRVPVSQGYAMFKLLQRQKVPARFVVFPDENHWIANGNNARQHMSEVLGWLKKHI